jgi:uncharacterized membrane protein
MTNSLKIKKLVGLATLTALVVGLQFLSNNVTFGSISITLALIPIAMGAILYGPLVGFFLGAVMGGIVLAAPSTQTVFMSVNLPATIILCILKTGIAGLVSGLLFKLFAYLAKNKENKKTKNAFFAAGIIVAALVVPVINTGLFILGASIFFTSIFGNFVGVINAVITTNFLVEFLVSAVLSPALVTLVRVLTKQYNLGFGNDFSEFTLDDTEEELEEVTVSA